MRVKLTSTGEHAVWQIGELVTVKVTAVEEDGSYEVETIETYAPDLKEQHARQLGDQDAFHIGLHNELAARHVDEVARLTALIPKETLPEAAN